MPVIALDETWLRAHPLPVHPEGTDKNSRGHVVLVGGCAKVPGALRLTAEAAFRAGAGKVQMATIEAAAMALGVLLPEAATVALPTDEGGEIDCAAIPVIRALLERCDTFILGPGMGSRDCARMLVDELLAEPRDGCSILLDAAAIACATHLSELLGRHEGRMVLTPHLGEMAALTGETLKEIAADPDGAAAAAAGRYQAVIVLKSSETCIAAPDGRALHYTDGGIGLATGGSGDVLAGIIGGLMARGAEPFTAAAWGVWLHGAAGQAAARAIGPIGFLASELLPHVPRLMHPGD